MYSYFLKKRLLLALILSSLFPFVAFSADSQMTIVLDPDAPGPYQSVKVSVQSYSFDVNTSYIEWTVGNTPFTAGLGIKNITINTGDVGSNIPISVKVSTRDGQIIQSATNLSPQSVDVVWESIESYVPPFYEGKALPGEGSVVRLTALPNFSDGGAQVPPSNLSFSWYMNDRYLEESSGIGKQAALIPLDILSDETVVRVRVRSTLGGVAEKKISLFPHDVVPVVYLYDDILGTNRERAILKRLEAVKDFTVTLAPYYLSTRSGLEGSANYEWLLDGLPVTPPEKTILSLRPKENSYGTKQLSLLVSNSKRSLQKARTDIELIFDTRK